MSQTEEVNLQLPQWPPQAEAELYPNLYKWKIEINRTGQITSFYQTEGTLKVSFLKNQPASITARPITLLDDGEKTSYFHPAGFLYPSNYNPQGQNSLSWEAGYIAELMHKIISSQQETGISDSRLLKFLFSFNWKKAQESINSKIEKSKTEEAQVFYNPWLLDTSKLLDNLCYGSFKGSLLNISGTYSYSLETLFPNQEFFPLSAFIPENSSLRQKNQISLKKEKAQLLADGHKRAVIFTPYSAKNLSRVYTYMPIYFEGP
ncbi:MAG: hypothetical protein K6C97_04585 [Treponema sp.]|nr:hypothetical protein [Treponema sp.]